MRKDLKYVAPLMAVLLLVAVARMVAPKPLDWSPNFSASSELPFGNKALYTLISDIFPGKKMVVARYDMTRQLQEGGMDEGNYLFITREFSPTHTDTERLLRFAREGGNVFVAARSFAGPLADSLRIETAFFSFPFKADDIMGEDSVRLVARVSELSPDSSAYYFPKSLVGSVFSRLDSIEVDTLTVNAHGDATFIRLKYGEGQFLFCSTPLLFTNYQVLKKEGAAYIAEALSCLPVENVCWDEYYKPGNNRTRAQTPLRFILSEAALKWGLFMSLGTLILFMVFGAKRRQRIIPELPALRNERLLFARTLGGLYQSQGDQRELAKKRIAYLEYYLRQRYHLTVHVRDADFVALVSQRTGIERDALIRLTRVVGEIKSDPVVGAESLEKLNASLERIYEILKK